MLADLLNIEILELYKRVAYNKYYHLWDIWRDWIKYLA